MLASCFAWDPASGWVLEWNVFESLRCGCQVPLYVLDCEASEAESESDFDPDSDDSDFKVEPIKTTTKARTKKDSSKKSANQTSGDSSTVTRVIPSSHASEVSSTIKSLSIDQSAGEDEIEF